jgi:hypothetical protein
LASFLVRPLRLASRLLELLFRGTEFALELLQLALQIADLTLDGFDPVAWRILGTGYRRYYRGTSCDERATAATARRGFVPHTPPLWTKKGFPYQSKLTVLLTHEDGFIK